MKVVGLSIESPSVELQAKPLPYALEPAAVTKNLAVDPVSGLNATAAAQRRTHYGANELETVHSRAAWRILLDQFKSR